MQWGQGHERTAIAPPPAPISHARAPRQPQALQNPLQEPH